MANLSVIDTGFLKTTNTGTQLSATNRANSGSLITFKAVDFKPTAKGNLDNAPTLGTYTDSEVHLVSVENVGFNMMGKLDMTDSTDRALVYQLLRLCRTRGYKALFYDVDRATTDTGGNTSLRRDQQLVTLLANAHYDTTEPQGDISFSAWTGTASATGKNLTNVVHIHVRFMDVNFSQSADTKIVTFTLRGVITA